MMKAVISIATQLKFEWINKVTFNRLRFLQLSRYEKKSSELIKNARILIFDASDSHLVLQH